MLAFWHMYKTAFACKKSWSLQQVYTNAKQSPLSATSFKGSDNYTTLLSAAVKANAPVIHNIIIAFPWQH